MLAIHVAELAQSAQERVDGRGLGLRPDHVGGRGSRTQNPDPVDLARGLGAGYAGHRKSAEGETAEEGTPVHQSFTSSRSAAWAPGWRMAGGESSRTLAHAPAPRRTMRARSRA